VSSRLSVNIDILLLALQFFATKSLSERPTHGQTGQELRTHIMKRLLPPNTSLSTTTLKNGTHYCNAPFVGFATIAVE
jgi:hypothetical protein